MNVRRLLGTCVLGGMTVMASVSAWGHAFMIEKQVPAGAWHMVEIAIPHGCYGSPTTEVSIKAPEGVFNARPEVKTGWTLSTRMKKLDEPIRTPEVVITEIVDEMTWSGGKLDDLYLERFNFLAKMPNEPGRVLYFKVVQKCEEGELRWIEIPEPGEDRRQYLHPAPTITLVEPVTM